MVERSAAEIFRDFNTDGIPASGVHAPNKAEIRQWGTEIEAAVSTLPDGLTLGALASLDSVGLAQIAPGLVRYIVASRTTTVPPSVPTTDIVWIVGASATGAWATHDKQIAIWDGSAWTFAVPSAGWMAYTTDAFELVVFDGTAWSAVVGGSGVFSTGMDGRVVGYFGGNGQSGVSLRGFWTADNRIFVVGDGVAKGNSDETTQDNYLPIQVPWDRTIGITSIVTGLSSHYLIDSNNQVWSWGANSVGQLGHGDTTNRAIPKLITALSGISITKVIPPTVNGSNYTAVFFLESSTGGSTGRVWGCGSGANYVFGNSSTADQNTPIRIGTLTSVVEVAWSNNNGPVFFRTSTPAIYVTGGPNGVANGLGTGSPAQVPTRLTTLDNEGIFKMAVGAGAGTPPAAVAVLLKGTGVPLVCGTGNNGLGFGNTTTLTAFTEITSRPNNEIYDDVAVLGSSCLVAFKSTAKNLHLVGYGGSGVLGSGTTSDMTSIVAPTGAFQGNVDSIALGGPDGNQVVAVKSAGALWTCGFESVGQTAQGTYGRAATARTWGKVAGLDGTIASWGWNGAAATAGLTVVLTDGRVFAAGGNTSGETGTQPGNLHGVTTLQPVLGLPAIAQLPNTVYASPAFTGTPTAPTAALGDSSTTIATTAFVQGERWHQPGNHTAPGLNPQAFTSTPAGTPTSGAVLGSGAANNGAWRITNSAQYVCMRDWVRVDAGVPLSIQAVVQRIVDSTSNIEVGCICMNASGTELTPRVLITSNPAVADGRTTLSFTIADVLTSHDGVAATWPSGTVYIRPYVQTLGTSHTTDIISISAPATPPVNVSTTQTTGVLIVDPVGFVMQELLPPATASASSVAPWSDGHTLWGLNSGFARLLDSQAISVKLALVGDSWTERRIIPQAIADRVYALYGQGADGWLQPAITSGNNINSVAKPTFANFTTYDVNDVTPSLPYGPDGFRVDCATTTGTIGWTGIRAATIYIYYRDTTGTFRYRTDGGAWTTVTGGGTNATAKATISGLSTGSTHSLDIDTTGNAGTVQIFGAYATGMTGVEISHIANSGTTSADIEGVCNTTTAQYILADIAPVAAQINLGTNDCVAAISGTAYEASLRNIIAAYASHNTQMGTVLVAPPRNNRGGAIAMEDYAAACMRIAASISCEYIDFTRVWSAWANENSAGMWTDTTHLNSAGAQRMGRRIVGKFYDLGN